MAQLEGREIGLRIRQARLESGMTQDQVAAVASFSKRSLQDYERGVTIPWAHMREIAAITAKQVEWLLHGQPSEQPAENENGERLTAIEQRLGLLEARVSSTPTSEELATGLQALQEAIQSLATRGREREGAPARSPGAGSGR